MVAMETLSIYDLNREWTFEDLQLLPDELGCRFEIEDGTLVVSPSPSKDHEGVLALLNEMLVHACPGEFLVIPGNPGVGFDRSYRVPDLIVVDRQTWREQRREPGFFDPRDVLLAVEVVSPDSKIRDRVVKPMQYAKVGIPSYWRLETDPISLTAYRLGGGEYVESGTWRPGEIAHLDTPFPVAIDIAQFV